MSRFRRSKKPVRDIAPDEIFLDARNLPQFNRDQFEGKIEKPISRHALVLFSLAVFVLLSAAVARVFYLQVVRGEALAQHAENNRLDGQLIFSQRGLILDRIGTELAWNESRLGSTSTSATSTQSASFPLRRYDAHPAFSHLLGYVRYPQKDENGHYFQDRIEGVDGAELFYNEVVSGESGRMIVERDAHGKVISQSTISYPVDGVPLQLSIDARVQKALYDKLQDRITEVGFSGGAGVILDVGNGEILASVSVPGYDSNVLSDGADTETIASYHNDPNVPFLNRAVGGLYTPGSVIKPFLAIGALVEHIVSPEKEFYSDGSLRVPNPYNPDQPTIFKDWKAHGWVDMRRALAVSSNVYFMTIGGGFGDQKGLGIQNIEKYVRLFGVGEKTNVDIPGEVAGVIPSIAWKQEHFPDDPWRLGDTYNSSIGQYGFQVTPIQMASAAARIANGGMLVTPHVRVDTTAAPSGTLAIDPEVFRVVREGMREAAVDGTTNALDVPYVALAIKTGTAELGVAKETVNSWVIGFWPYEEPRYAFAVVLERGPSTNLVGSAFVMRQVFDWMRDTTPEYLASEGAL